MKVESPLYIIESSQACWSCQHNQRVIALASFSMTEDEDDEEAESFYGEAVLGESTEPYLFSNLISFPEPLEAWLRSEYPLYRPHFSVTAEESYWANLCECGANFGDFYLSKPGSAFFPMNPQDCSVMRIREVPLTGSFEIDGGWGMGSGGLIFAHAQRI